MIYDPASAGEFGMAKAGYMERLVGVGQTTMRFSGISQKDALVVVSNSGLNNEPVEAALYGRELGVPVIAITSVSYSSSHQTRHSGGKKLMDLADVVIDTGVPFPDAMIKMKGLEQANGPCFDCGLDHRGSRVVPFDCLLAAPTRCAARRVLQREPG